MLAENIGTILEGLRGIANFPGPDQHPLPPSACLHPPTLQALMLDHPRAMRRDCAHFAPFRRNGRPVALRRLAAEYLGADIQHGEHSSVVDAQVAMALYRIFRYQWERARRGASAARGKRLLDATGTGLRFPPRRKHAATVDDDDGSASSGNGRDSSDDEERGAEATRRASQPKHPRAAAPPSGRKRPPDRQRSGTPLTENAAAAAFFGDAAAATRR